MIEANGNFFPYYLYPFVDKQLVWHTAKKVDDLVNLSIWHLNKIENNIGTFEAVDSNMNTIIGWWEKVESK